MKAKDIIKTIMEKSGITNAVMSDRLDITQAAFWDRLNNKKHKDIGVNILCDMARVLDYKIVVVPRNTRVPDTAFTIDNTDEVVEETKKFKNGRIPLSKDLTGADTYVGDPE